MHRALRLGINGLAGRRSRTALLVIAVTLSTALVAAVGCALASVNAGMKRSVEATLGRADLRVREVAGQRLDPGVLEFVRGQPSVEVAAPRAKGSIPLKSESGVTVTAVGVGIDPSVEYLMIDPPIAQGARVERADDAVLSPDLAAYMKVQPGDTLSVVKFGKPVTLRVAGIAARGQADVVQRFEATVTREALSEITGTRERLNEIAVVLREGVEPDAEAARMQAAAPENVMVQTTARVTSGVARAVRANTLGFVIASTLASLAAAAIVVTGLTTAVLERQRELAIMRALGAQRGTLAAAQLAIGAIIGSMGAAIGVPLGIGLALVMTLLFPDKLPAGLVIEWWRVAWAAGAAVLAGLAGASWPAIAAARTRPLEGMSKRGRPATRRAVLLSGVIGLALIAWQIVVIHLPIDAGAVFWGHVLTGLPAMLVGYFLLGVPVAIVVARLVGPLIAGALRLPGRLLVGSVTASPFRAGFTAAALMLGLAMMTDLWTTGSALLRDWVGAIKFPDAFAADWSGLSPDDLERVRGIEFVADVCPITLLKIDNTAFGLSQINNPPTNFVAFEPESFFRMTRLAWVAGDEAYARKRLAEGGAVIVAQEFLVARQGYEIGDTFIVTHKGVEHPMEVVGAVSSPGLDLVGYAFDLGREYQDVAISSVFGTRADLQRVFGSEAIHLMQMQYRPNDLSDLEAAERIRQAIGRAGVIVGSGREIKEGVSEIGRSSMRIASIVALAAMLISSLGVASVVLAGVDARRFEFGVLRAVGASCGLLGRLIVAEVLLLIVTACVLGTTLGLQGSLSAMRLYELLAGIRLRLVPPIDAIAAGWLLLAALTLVVVSPLVVRVTRARARELLASTRG